jgi:ribonuclease D
VPSKHPITKDELNLLELRQYKGRICLITTAQELEKAIGEIRKEKVVGLDTETRPAFHRGQYFLPSLVQVAGEKTVFLFQLKRLQFSKVLTEVLENPQLIKAGIGLADDLGKLREVFRFEPRNIVDLSDVAQRQGIKQSGVRNLAGSLLGFRVPKGGQTSNWSSPRLSQAQLVYAATDAWVCRELFLRFQELGFLDSAGRSKV